MTLLGATISVLIRCRQVSIALLACIFGLVRCPCCIGDEVRASGTSGKNSALQLKPDSRFSDVVAKHCASRLALS
jgi:hypothetical protein